MAIAFDAASNSTSTSWSHTCSGSATILIIFVYSFPGAITAATYNGVSMTAGPVSAQFASFYLFNPASGTNTIAITGGSHRDAVAVSYTGTDTSALDATGKEAQSGEAGSHTSSITTTADNSWPVFGFGLDTAPSTLTAGTATTSRATSNTIRPTIAVDSNAPKTPAGSITLEVSVGTAGSSGRWLKYSLKPGASANTSAFFSFFLE